jgi:alanyl aminopeptidase
MRAHRSLTLLVAASLALAGACASTSAKDSSRDDDTEPVGFEPPPPPPEDLRLPDAVRPLAYRIDLEVDPREPEFAGHVEIDIELEERTKQILLHGEKLAVDVAHVRAGGGQVPAHYTELGEGFAALSLRTPVGPGPATLRIAYTAPFDVQLEGLYRVEVAGEHYAFTQFEPLAARRAFPGFDEPRFKTPFEMKLTVPDGHQALANTPALTSVRTEDGRVTTTFAPTRPLPTYLVAVATGPLDVVDAGDIPGNEVRPGRVPLRGVAVKGQGPRLAYALKHTGALLALLEKRLGVPYPYEKLDIVAVPDFSSGAMENVGLITFRDMLLFVDEETSPLNIKRWFAETMAHELAHQWFGNLVTMAWWDDLWLNESFATWLGIEIADEFDRDLGIDAQSRAELHGAMNEDSLASARRIREPIHTAGDILNAFDGITYAKGGAVLDMFAAYAGSEAFARGLKRYLDAHADGNATVHDLLRALDTASEKPISEAFSTFLERPGVPQVGLGWMCVGDANTLLLSQKRYRPIGSEAEALPPWKIPVCVKMAKGDDVGTRCFLLDESKKTVPLGSTCPDWVLPDAGAAGYYRWVVGGGALAKLARAQDALTPREQLNVLDAAQSSLMDGSLRCAEVLESASLFLRSKEPDVARAAAGLFWLVLSELVADERIPLVRAHAQRMHRPVLDEVGGTPVKGEPWRVAERRAVALEQLALVAEEDEAIALAADLGRRYVGELGDGAVHPDAVAPALVGAAITSAVRAGDATFFEGVAADALKSDDPLVRRHLLAALLRVTDPALAAKARALLVDERLRTNEVWLVLDRPLRDPRTRDAHWAWFTKDFDAIAAKVPEAERGWLPWAAAAFCDTERANQADAFFRPRLDQMPGGERQLAQVLESVRLCAARKKAQGESADAFFENWDKTKDDKRGVVGLGAP